MTDVEPPYLVKLDITSFIGISIEAEHYYGKVHINNKSNKGGYGAPRHSLDGTVIKQPLTADMARILNEKDSCLGSCMYSEGESTERFDTRDQVIEASKQFFSENFDGETDVLVIEKEIKSPKGNWYETGLDCIAGPDEISRQLEEAGSNYAEQEKVLRYHKYTREKASGYGG